MVESRLKVKLLRYTPIPENIIAQAARLCYSKSEIDDLLEKMSDEKCQDLLKKLVDLGHESPIEHAYFTFAIEGISRACSHQLVRHRIASYSQQSQRYVDSKEFNYIIPPTIKRNKILLEKFEKAMSDIGELYQEISKDVPKEDARFILPNACETKIIVTMNARSLKNFFAHRVCNRAQWEIRDMAKAMLAECKAVAPILFSNMGASCVCERICPEGEMNCGLWKTIPGGMIKYKGEIIGKEEYQKRTAK